MPHVVSNSLVNKPLGQFLDELDSAEPVPGGGSAAALAGALAASLLSMVCRLTLDKKGYESVAVDMRQLLAYIEPKRAELRQLMQADVDAYADVMRAYQLPKTTPAEKQTRAQVIQESLKRASEVPFRVVEVCASLLDLAPSVAAKGNRHAISDAGVGALMAEAGLRGAALNVSINLASIQDKSFVHDYRARLEDLGSIATRRKQETIAIVEGKL